jgi:hypothetical protein
VPTLRERPSFLFTVVRWLFICGLLMGTFLGSLYVARELELLPRFDAVARAPGKADKPDSAKKVAAEPGPHEEIEATTAEGSHRAELALAKVRQRQVFDQAKGASETLEQVLKEAKAFDDLTTKLLQDEDGKMVGASRDRLSEYVALSEVEKPSTREIERWKAAVLDLMRPIEVSLEDPSDAALPPPDLVAELKRYEEDAEEAVEVYRSARDQLDAIITAAKSSGEKGTATLREALASRRNEEARKGAETLERARADAQKEAADQIQAAEAEKARVVAEKELEVKKAQLKAELEQKEYERKKKLAESPAIQAQFAPFLTKGRWLYKKVMAVGPEAGHWSKFELPASYSALLKGGYLADLEGFALAMSGNTYTWQVDDFNKSNDRPRVKYPDSPDEWRRMDELYKLFLEIGPVWVEMGLLEK